MNSLISRMISINHSNFQFFSSDQEVLCFALMLSASCVNRVPICPVHRWARRRGGCDLSPTVWSAMVSWLDTNSRVCVGGHLCLYAEWNSRVGAQLQVVDLIGRYKTGSVELCWELKRRGRGKKERERDAGFWANFRPTCAKTPFTWVLFLQPILSVM